MQLMHRRSDGSFYESFSDLIFCALVLFVALVMVLAANVGVQVDSLKTVQADLEQSKEKLKSAVNSHRYTGASSAPVLSLAIDVRQREPRYFFIPRVYMDSFDIPIINETADQALLRQRTAIFGMSESVEQQRGLTKEEFQSVLKAFSYHTTIPTDIPWLGIEIEEIGNQIAVSKVYPYSKFPKEQVGAMILQIDDRPIRSISDLRDCMSNLAADKEQVKVLAEKHSKQFNLQVKLLRHFYEGLSPLMCDLANSAASGWKLIGEGLGLEQSPQASSNPSESAKSFELTLSRAREEFAAVSLMESGPLENDESSTVLQMNVLDTDQQVRVGGVLFQLSEAVILLRSISTGNVAVEFVNEQGQATASIPEWVHSKLLNPTGFINRAPDLQAVEKWLVASEKTEPALE
jgi:hypothetical protein